MYKGYTGKAEKSLFRFSKGQHVSWSELRDAFGIPVASVGSVIHRLAVKGYIKNISKGRYEVTGQPVEPERRRLDPVNAREATVPTFQIVPYRNDGTVLIITPKRTFIAQEVTLQKLEGR